MLSNAIFKLVNLFAILGYLFNIISMFTKYDTGKYYYNALAESFDR